MTPDWFQQHLDQRPEHRYIEVDGAIIHYQYWPATTKRDHGSLIFVHGHAAHAHWWDFIAPAFRDRYDLVALDMSGSGDSDHRAAYSAAAFGQEILAVSKDAGLQKPTIVGHSFGGAMTRIAAWQHRDAFSEIVLVDSAIPHHKGARTAPPMPKIKERYYPSLKEGMRRFRLRPPQACENQYVLDHIAAHSLKTTEQGFQFKYDSAVFAKMQHTEDFPSAADMIKDLTIPVNIIYGEKSRFFPSEAVAELTQLVDQTRIWGIPDAHHHVFLDQPIGFIDVLNDLLSR
ncbi:MAG: alpha/beta hydrolase [Pseudomonadales bacterium]|nr:alpha/beta hydrolase [Pseudomonadales bacterium]MBO6594324.1 alpha/beta hydrolase [Pseudomonadales bacterium]MBO6822115.1 alpha/beta hydrolase [Pseudomonadales bacterium]